MIALISFGDDLILTKEEALRMGLSIARENIKVGYSEYFEKLRVMRSDGDFFVDELEERVEDGGRKWYLLNPDKAVSQYNIFRRVPEADYVEVKASGHLVKLEDFVSKNPPRFYIERTVLEGPASLVGLENILSRLEEKTYGLRTAIDSMAQHTFNQKVNVHVGGGLIVTYNDLKLLENACTDAVQTALNNGWRIIAVCVQPDSRRPDYVLGRYNPELEVAFKEQADR